MACYTTEEFNKEYPDDDACLQTIFKQRYGNLSVCPNCSKNTKFHKVSNRKCYACQYCGFQLHPLADTIFNKSSTPLKLWFSVAFLMSHSDSKISAKKLQKLLGVTYKTAWRMIKEFKVLMQ
jgi:transposase-like protein